MRRLVRCALVLAAATAYANPPPVPRQVRDALGAATVEVLPARCTGAVVESPWLIATAKHCVEEGKSLRVRVAGAERQAVVVAEDDVADQVVLVLDEPAAVTPLGIVRRIPIAGTVLYFHGNPARPRWQAARLDRVGECPSLPHLPNALFTSIDGTPGDSGAPLVDLLGRVVGLVHGGARCRIATPGDRLVRLVDRVLERQRARTPLIAPTRSGSRVS